MALVIAQDHYVALLKPTIVYLKTLTIRLFRNDHTPMSSDTVADYTEADFDGYAPHDLPDWGLAYLNKEGKAETDHPNIHFFKNGPDVSNTIYGYYVTDSASDLVWAERNPEGPVTMNTTGDLYIVGPTFMGFQC